MTCFECGSAGPIHDHHVVPKSKGGTNTVPLCELCHGLVHGQSMHISELTRESLRRRKAAGVRLGRPRHPQAEVLAAEAQVLRETGATFQSIADRFNDRGEPTLRGGSEWRPSSVQKLLRNRDYDRELAEGCAS